jgi:hypothetical protein
MTPDDLRVITDAVKVNIEKTVNGHVREISAKLDGHIAASADHWAATQEFMIALMPVKEGIGTIQAVVKFSKWLGLPAIGVLAAWLYSKL